MNSNRLRAGNTLGLGASSDRGSGLNAADVGAGG